MNYCPMCGHRIEPYFLEELDDEQIEYCYECIIEDGGCGWTSNPIRTDKNGTN